MERKVKEEQRIEDEATDYANDSWPFNMNKYKGYIAGATKEAERNKEDAIVFAEWKFNNRWNTRVTNKEGEFWSQDYSRPWDRPLKTTEQLYEIYINQKV